MITDDLGAIFRVVVVDDRPAGAERQYEVASTAAIGTVTEVGHVLVPHTGAQRHVGRNTLHAAKLLQEGGGSCLYFAQVDLGFLDGFAVEVDLIVVELAHPILLPINGHEVHVQQGHATLGVELAADPTGVFGADLLTRKVTRAGEHEKHVLQPDFLLDGIDESL